MSIQTEITRLNNAKAAIKTAIEGKGVTVPNDTLLDGVASLIESIESGGKSLLFDLPYVTGSFTAAEDITSTYTICTLPNSVLINANRHTASIGTFCIWGTKSPHADKSKEGLNCGVYTYWYVGGVKSKSYAFSYGLQSISYGDGTISFNNNVVQLNLTSSKIIPAGRNYNWIYMPFVYE